MVEKQREVLRNTIIYRWEEAEELKEEFAEAWGSEVVQF